MPAGGVVSLTKAGRFSRAIAGKPVDHPPVWLMRQAGRYLPQYRAVRGRQDFRAICRTPEIAVQLSLQPLDVLDVDAVIVFNDLLIPLGAAGVEFVYTGHGPEILRPVRTARAVRKLKVPGFDREEPVARSLRLLRREIGEEVALIGFAGAPFTLACYLVEGVLTPNLGAMKRLLASEPRSAHTLLEKLATLSARYLALQIEAGADVVQIFDTWAGALSLPAYREFALRYVKRVIADVRSHGVPVILYVNDCAAHIEAMAESGADVLSVDWRLPLSVVRRRVGKRVALQGNLDPTTLFASPARVTEATRTMLRDVNGDSRYIANLGHGVLPGTPVASVKAFVQAVKRNKGDTHLF